MVNITITATSNNVCSGTQVTFNSTASNGGGNPFYQWQVNGINTGTNSSSYSYTPLNNDLVRCILTSSITGCIMNNPDTSNAITMIVNPILAVSVSISASSNPFCQGSTITFTATPINGGTTPDYQWKVNGTNVGTNNPVYAYIPANGDIVSCVINSSVPCPTGNPATSNTITMTEDNNVVVSVSIAPSQLRFVQEHQSIHCNTGQWRQCTGLSMESQWDQCRDKQSNLFLCSFKWRCCHLYSYFKCALCQWKPGHIQYCYHDS